MVKKDSLKDQKAFEYALYMIASSYFDKVTCKSKRVETNLLLQYREEKSDTQYHMEDICIRFMDGMKEKIPTEVFEKNTEVFIRKSEKSPAEIVFVSGRYLISIVGIYSGKNSKIDYEIWSKAA